jgi:hypothetical protein
MTYSVASTILRDDYNIFATGAANGSATNSGNVNNLWGTGNSQYGWGQSTTISAVSAGNTITAAQWSTLSSRINSIRSHQTGTGVTFTNTTGGATSNFTAGQVVYHVSNLSSALSTAYTAANTASATTGSMACYSTAQQGSTTTSSAYLDNMQPTELYMSFTWTSAAAMRYFFNSGGYLEFAFNVLNAGGSSKNASWANLAQDLGTIRFGGLATAYTGYSGTWNTNTSYGLNNVPTTETLWWKKYNDTGVADYNNNYIQCTVYNSGATIYFHVTAVDVAADDGTAADYIYSNLDWTGKVYEAGQTYITKTWGTVSTSTFPAFTSVTNSLRFRGSASAYLSRTNGTPSSTKIFTLSFWLKRGNLGTRQSLYTEAVVPTNNGILMYLTTSDTLQCQVNVNGTAYVTQTSAVLRDPSAWYHIVYTLDTTQTSATDRVVWYINGKVASLKTLQYPSQNDDPKVNASGYTTWIGIYNDVASYLLDGYLSEVYMIDGQALGPNEFAAIDSHGVYSPISYTGTYGNNGFYLNFADNSALTTSSNAGLGKDTSGKGNYWTTNNISITSGITYDSMIDVPVNAASGTRPSGNYAVLNSAYSSYYGNPSSGSPNNVEGNLGTYYKRTVSTIALPPITAGSTKKIYWEIRSAQNETHSNGYSSTAYPRFGIVALEQGGANGSEGAGFNLYSYWDAPPAAGNNVVYQVFGGSQTVLSGQTYYVDGDIIMFAYDAATGKLWHGRNGVWYNSGDPVTGTNPAATLSSSYTYAPYIEGTAYNNASLVTRINFGQLPFRGPLVSGSGTTYTGTGAAPTGYVALCIPNLTAPTIG